MNIVIIDYGIGNPLSIKNMLQKIGANSTISNEMHALENADKLILPGVGHFAKGMDNLHKSGLSKILNELVTARKKPVLGICLGMQLMTRWSDEGELPGLGWIEASTRRFNFTDPTVKVPHMGWTDTYFRNPLIQTNRFEELPPRFYYVHSYYVTCKESEEVLCEAEYGNQTFTSGFVKENVMGVQFHPEKSHVFGMEFLRQFISWNP